MQYKLKAPGLIDTTIHLPSSKSVSNRALVMNALAQGSSLPCNLSDCDDTEVMVSALRDMPGVIDLKGSGTAMRFLTAYFSVTPGVHTLIGTERMKHRPIKALVEALRYLGAKIEYLEEEGFPPLRIAGGELEGGRLETSGSISSQYISALLMVGPCLKRGLELKLTGQIVSRPYIDLTLHTMRDFGVSVEWTDIDTIKVEHQNYTPAEYVIENDWTAASYWYEAMALCNDAYSELKLPRMADGSRQGDAVVKYLFSMLGVKTLFETTGEGLPTTVTLKKVSARLPRLDYDFVNQPDLVQTLVVCCSVMNIPFRFTGLSSLKIKETDRIEALKAEMRKLGYVLKDVDGCELVWDGERCEATMEPIDTYGDHRMAMAFAPLCFHFPGLRINDPHVVSKSYPRFWDDLKQAGFTIEEIDE